MTTDSDHAISIRKESNGATRVGLRIDEREVSRLWIVPYTLRIGSAEVRVDGIGGVGTEEDCRNRGYSRRVLEAAVRHMRQGDAALSILYGINDFYDKFGFISAGPDHRIHVYIRAKEVSMPAGWTVRPLRVDDLPAVRRLYETNTARSVSTAIRAENGSVWARLDSAVESSQENECRIVECLGGGVAAYAWRSSFWPVGLMERDDPDSFVFAEVMAEDARSADAVLAACRLWGAEEASRNSAPVEHVVIAQPPEGPIANAARQLSGRFVQIYSRCGGFMAEVLNLDRLLNALKPELDARIRAAREQISGRLRLETEVGTAVLSVSPEGVAIDEKTSDGVGDGESVRLPQTTLARLAFGAYPPGDLLARLEPPITDRVRDLIESLFPQRHPHMHLPDRC